MDSIFDIPFQCNIPLACPGMARGVFRQGRKPFRLIINYTIRHGLPPPQRIKIEEVSKDLGRMATVAIMPAVAGGRLYLLNCKQLVSK
jgi:hypothetical protein